MTSRFVLRRAGEEDEEAGGKEDEGHFVAPPNTRNFIRILNKNRFNESKEFLVLCNICFNMRITVDKFMKYVRSRANQNDPKSNIRFPVYSKTDYDELEVKARNNWIALGISRNSMIKFNTLQKMACQDNPYVYESIISETNHDIVKDMLYSGYTDDMLSNVFFNIHPNDLIYEDISKSWYRLNEFNYWIKQNDIYSITNIIPMQMIPFIKKIETIMINAEFTKSMNDPSNDKNFISVITNNSKRMVSYLSNIRTKKNIVENLIDRYREQSFYTLMNVVNKELFAFKNGVWDLKNGIFRLPNPEEFMTMFCDYNYKAFEHVDKEALKFLNRIISDILRNEPEKSYVLTTIAQCLTGQPLLEKFYIWKGQGRNGKGVLSNLIIKTFGPYHGEIEISYFDANAKRRSANEADEVLYNKKFCRIIIVSEPSQNVELDASIINSLSGFDSHNPRCIYGHQGSENRFTPSFHLFFPTNFDLSMAGTEMRSTANRPQIYVFTVNFCDEKDFDKTNPNNKPIDVTIKSTINNLADINIAFFHILIDYYYTFKEYNDINIPQCVKNETSMFLVAACPFASFVKTHVRKYTPQELEERRNNNIKPIHDNIKMFVLYKKYVEFCTNCGLPAPKSNKEFNSQMRASGFTPRKSNGTLVWINTYYTLYNPDEDDDEEQESTEETIVPVKCKSTLRSGSKKSKPK